jgi:hypothetical protein
VETVNLPGQGNSRCWFKGPDKGSTNFIGVIPTRTFHVGIPLLGHKDAKTYSCADGVQNG